MGDHPVLPDYGGACITNLIPHLAGRQLAGERRVTSPAWFPASVAGARQIVLLLLDGLGWDQWQQRRSLTPTLNAMASTKIATVVPSTTATALTSLTTGTTPGEHGVVGYRVGVHGEVLNILRWSTARADARRTIPPVDFQPIASFLGTSPPVVTRAEFEGSGFSAAHLAGARMRPWRMASTLVTEVRTLLASGEPFVYAYYDGVDKVAHEYGLGAHYDAELVAADRLVSDLLQALPSHAQLVVTADHGQVDVGSRVLPLHAEVLTHVALQSGEGRMRWLHAKPGQVGALHEAASAHFGDVAWVVSREEAVESGWFGPRVADVALDRLGDVVLAAHADIAFDDPADTGPFRLVARHGSLTEAEMLVPLLVSS